MGAPAEEGSYDRRRGRQRDDDEPKIEQKHFLPLPKPKHLVYIKPTVAVVAAPAPRNSVGLKMTADGKALESYVVEFYQRRL